MRFLEGLVEFGDWFSALGIWVSGLPWVGVPAACDGYGEVFGFGKVVD